MNTKAFPWIIAAVLLVIGIAVVVMVNQPKTPDQQPVISDPQMLLIGGNGLYIPDQKPGSTISSATVIIDQKAYLVIHEAINGKAGEVIGVSAMLEAGTHEQVSVPLNRSVVQGEELIGMLHASDGQNGFVASSDLAIKDPMGNEIWMIFSVDANASDPGTISL